MSRLTLRTRPRDRSEGFELLIEGGAAPATGPCGMATGTIVEVRDLFYNVPARRKFLKSLTAESAAITATLEGVALSCPSITITLSRDGKQVKQWLRANDREQRAKQCRADDGLMAVEGTAGPMTVQAFLGPPEKARTGMTGLTLLVNARVVKDRSFARVVAQAYGSILEPGRYPVGVVYLDVEPSLVDVNVHPQKAEVRFADTRAVLDGLYHVLSDGLGSVFGLSHQPPTRFAPMHPPWSGVPREPIAQSEDRGVGILVDNEPDAWGLGPQPAAPPPHAQQIALPISPVMQPVMDRPAYGCLRFLAQAHKTYLVCESDQGLVIIDQHAAAERVSFARLREAYQHHAVASQRLLMPETIAVSDAESAFLEESSEEVSRLGMEIRPIGPGQALVEAVPQIVSRASPERLARDLLDEAMRAGGRGFSNAVDRVIATMACHGSIRSGDVISAEQAVALLKSLDEVDHSGHCPHGRPLVFAMRVDELERQVSRR